MSTDVAIIGLGCILAHGQGDEAMDRVLAGECAASVCEVGGERYAVGRVRDVLPVSADERDRAVSLALAAADLAMRDAGLDRAADAKPAAGASLDGIAPERFACLIALSKGGLGLVARVLADPAAAAARWPTWLAEADPTAAMRHVACRYGLRGAMLAPVSACASGGHVLARARALLLEGRADAVLCGAADASLLPPVLSSYRRLGVLAPVDGAPERCCRPFEADRAGFYVGEGAAAFVLTSAETAARLRRRPRARLVAAAEGAFAHSLVTVPSDGRDLAHMISVALGRAGVHADEVDLVAAHGTATRDGDLNEARAIRLALGDRAARVSVMATKPLHGHLLGAACAVESALVVRAVETGRLPPTICLACADGPGDLGYIAEARSGGPVSVAVKLSAGFGGQVSVNVFRTA